MFHLNKKMAKTGRIYKARCNKNNTGSSCTMKCRGTSQEGIESISILLSVDKYYVQKLCQCVQMWDS